MSKKSRKNKRESQNKNRRNENVIKKWKKMGKNQKIDKNKLFYACPPRLPPNVEIIWATYEADVLIGLKQGIEHVVVSNDSDLLAYL